MRTPIFAGNWKMNKLVTETEEFVIRLGELLTDTTGLGTEYEVMIAPPATHLQTLGTLLSKTKMKLGAQNCGTAKSGAFTGEASPAVLKELGCTWSLIGHSERRHVFKEDDSLIFSRLKAGMEEGLNMMLCIGEILDDRKAGNTFKVVETQLSILKNSEFKNDWVERLAIAYEPVWAIGTGETATPEQAQEVHAHIRTWAQKNFSSTQASNLQILYGGSAKPENSAQLMAQSDVDGLLVGGASLDPVKFANLIKNGLESRPSS